MKTNSPNKEWQEQLDREGFTRKYPFANKDLEKIKQQLLRWGGWAVILSENELDFNECFARGKKFTGKPTLKLGQPNQCHANSALLWHETKGEIKICTGYALSEDGVWRVHTWGIKKISDKIEIIETTEERLMYFGYILSKMESALFLHINTSPREKQELSKFRKNSLKIGNLFRLICKNFSKKT